MPKGESNKFIYQGEVGTHKWYDGAQHPREFKRIWHLSLPSPIRYYLRRTEDPALFKTTDGGKTWQELAALAARRRICGTGRGGMCLHTILLHPPDPHRIYVAISAAGVLRTDDGGNLATGK